MQWPKEKGQRDKHRWSSKHCT